MEGWLHLVSQTDGRLVGRTRITKHPITARPLVVGNRLYVYATDGTLAVLTTGTAPARGAPGADNQSAVVTTDLVTPAPPNKAAAGTPEASAAPTPRKTPQLQPQKTP